MVSHAVVRAKSELCGGKRPPALGVWDPQPFQKKSKKTEHPKNLMDGNLLDECVHDGKL